MDVTTLLDPVAAEAIARLDLVEVEGLPDMVEVVMEAEVLPDVVVGVEAVVLLEGVEEAMEITETHRSCLLILKPNKLIMTTRVVKGQFEQPSEWWNNKSTASLNAAMISLTD